MNGYSQLKIAAYLTRYRSNLISVFWSLAGQGLNFFAMLLPVLLKSGEQLAYLLLPLSAAAILRIVFTAAFHVRYLTIGAEDRIVARNLASFGLTAFFFLTLLCALAMASMNVDAALVIASVALLTYCIGFYFVAVTVLIFEKEKQVYGTGRLIFGVLNFGSTLAMICLFDYVFGLVLATALTNIVVAVWMLHKSSLGLQELFSINWRIVFSRRAGAYLIASKSVISSSLISDLGYQVQGLLTPLMGPHKELWAIVVRLSGGFGTLGQQILAPLFEMRISEVSREKRADKARKLSVAAQLVGAGFGLVVAIALALILVFLYPEMVTGNSWLVWICFAYCWLLLASSLTMKVPYLLGHDRHMLYWSILRLVLTIPLFVFSGSLLLIILVAVQALVSLYLIYITVQKPNFHSAAV